MNPGRLALGTLGGLGKLAGVEREPALTASGRDYLRSEFRVLEALEQVEQVGLDVARRFADQPRDLRDGHRIVLEQRDEIFAEHSLQQSAVAGRTRAGRRCITASLFRFSSRRLRRYRRPALLKRYL